MGIVMKRVLSGFVLMLLVFFLVGCSANRYLNRKVKPELSTSDNIADVFANVESNNILNALTILERKRVKTILKAENNTKQNDSGSIVPFLKSRGIGTKMKNNSFAKKTAKGPQDLEIHLGSTEPDLVQFQNQLNEQTAAISYVVLKDSYGAFLIRNDSIQFYDFAIPKDVINQTIANVKSRLINPYDGNGHIVGADQHLLQGLYVLYQALFLPLEAELDGATSLIVIPAGSLQLIPLQVLTRNAAKPDYLLEKYNFTYTSSLTSLRESLTQSKRNFSLLIYGDPAHSSLSGEGMLPRIPYAGKEAQLVHGLFPRSDLFMGSAATEKNLKESIGDYAIVHLATHGYVDSENPRFSFLLTADAQGEDGVFSIQEILQAKINAELIILSACETAVGSGALPDNNVSGSMAMAFMSAGAESVVSSLWSVDDISTAKIMTSFYSRYGNERIGQSFRLAQLELMKTEGYSHPFFWGPFILYGSYL
jgi:CHAT domain-containing protein